MYLQKKKKNYGADSTTTCSWLKNAGGGKGELGVLNCKACISKGQSFSCLMTFFNALLQANSKNKHYIKKLNFFQGI